MTPGSPNLYHGGRPRMTTQVEPIRRTEAERTRAVVAVLTQRTPKEAVRYRTGPGGRTLAYVEGAWVIRQLNLAFGWDWDFEVRDRQVISGPRRWWFWAGSPVGFPTAGWW